MHFDDPQDRKALVMGLALHEQGKQSLEKVKQLGSCADKAIMPCTAICSEPFSMMSIKLAPIYEAVDVWQLCKSAADFSPSSASKANDFATFWQAVPALH